MVQQGPEAAAAAPTTPVTVMHWSTAPPSVLEEERDSPSRVRLVGPSQSAIAQRPRSSSSPRPYTRFCHTQTAKGHFSIGKQADRNGIRSAVAPGGVLYRIPAWSDPCQVIQDPLAGVLHWKAEPTRAVCGSFCKRSGVFKVTVSLRKWRHRCENASRLVGIVPPGATSRIGVGNQPLG